MFQFAYFLVIYSILIFMWCYVFANTKKDDPINVSFLLFLGIILLWLILNVSNYYITNWYLSFFIKTLYFISLLNLSVFFMNFVYRLVNRNYDRLFYGLVVLNTITVFSRFIFPIDYSTLNFWRLENVFYATVMATVLTIPMIWSIYLIVRYLRSTKNMQLKRQLNYVLLGISFASIVSILSEYVFPVYLNNYPQISLMYIAFLVLIYFLFLAIIKHQFLNVREEYIYQNLFIYSNEGILLIDENNTILSINNKAKLIFALDNLIENTKITEFINAYDFSNDYNQFDISVTISGEIKHLLISQSLIKTTEKMSAKLLHITDNTMNKIELKMEKEALLNQTNIDALTNIYNKRFYINNLVNSHNLIDKYLVVIFIDIDNFKLINDTYGHLFGDEIIKTVALNVKQSLRSSEIAIRYGGDEFLVILENNTLNDALRIAERIQERINSLDFSDKIDNFTLSLSMGISDGYEKIESLVENADKAMYVSKSNGKKKTTVYANELEI